MALSCNVFCQSFCHLLLFIFSQAYFNHKSCNIFIIKKLYNTSSELLLFLHRGDYCSKREFDTDVKIENYCHHDGEQ